MINNKDENIIFPDNVSEVVKQIRKKYGLEIIDEETGLLLDNFDNLPGKNLIKVIRKATIDKLSTSSLILEIQTQLNLSEEMAKNLAEELKEKILSQVKYEEEKEIKDEKEELPPIKSSKSDRYREPI